MKESKYLILTQEIILIKLNRRSYRARWNNDLEFPKLTFSVPIGSITDFIDLHSYTHTCRSTRIPEAR